MTTGLIGHPIAYFDTAGILNFISLLGTVAIAYIVVSLIWQLISEAFEAVGAWRAWSLVIAGMLAGVIAVWLVTMRGPLATATIPVFWWPALVLIVVGVSAGVVMSRAGVSAAVSTVLGLLVAGAACLSAIAFTLVPIYLRDTTEDSFLSQIPPDAAALVMASFVFGGVLAGVVVAIGVVVGVALGKMPRWLSRHLLLVGLSGIGVVAVVWTIAQYLAPTDSPELVPQHRSSKVTDGFDFVVVTIILFADSTNQLCALLDQRVELHRQASPTGTLTRESKKALLNSARIALNITAGNIATDNPDETFTYESISIAFERVCGTDFGLGESFP